MSAGAVTSPVRRRLLAGLADAVPRAQGAASVRDGVDGAGKTTFADELTTALAERGRAVVRVSLDDFLNPREVRHRRGRSSPEGFWRESIDYEAFRAAVLDPLGAEGDGRFRRAVYDVRAERRIDAPREQAPPGAVLVVDGLFLHRDELAREWDLSIFLDVPFAVTCARMAKRDGCSPDPDAAANHRYVEGDRLYLAACRPRERATVAIDNSDLAAPLVLASLIPSVPC